MIGFAAIFISAPRGRGIDTFQNPCIVWNDLLVVIFVYANLLETMSFVKSLGLRIRCLDVKINATDFRFCVRGDGR
jgi:hypothetical protein